MQKVRLFVALNPGDEIRKKLESVITGLRGSLRGSISWVRPENIHLTLKFIGEVDAERIPAIDSCLTRAARHGIAFGFEVEGLGCFPDSARPRVLWAGLRGYSDALPGLAAGIESELTSVGIPRERRRFSPHLTLARIRRVDDGPALQRVLDAYEEQFFGECWVRSFQLMESRLGRGGASYTELAGYTVG